MITKKLIEEILTSVENGKRQKDKERTIEINKACSDSEAFVQLCTGFLLYGIENCMNPVNTIGAGIIAGIDIGLKIAKKEQETCLTTQNQIN